MILCDSTGEFFCVGPHRTAFHIVSEGDLLDRALLDSLEFNRHDYAAIVEDPASPIGLEIVEITEGGCSSCGGTGTYSGPCQYRLDDRGWYAWGPSDEPTASHGECMCPDCRGSGRSYRWTGTHLTKAQLDAWSDRSTRVCA